MEKSYQAALKKASELELEVERLKERSAGYDEACLELAQVRSKYAKEVETVKKQSGERFERLRKEAAAEKDRLNNMIGELEGLVQEHKRSALDQEDRIKWLQARLTQLEGDLSIAWKEVEDEQSKVSDLRGRIDRVRVDKQRAVDNAKGLYERVTRLEGEIKARESETRALRQEVESGRERSATFERQVAEAERWAAQSQKQAAEADERATRSRKQAAEAELQLGMLQGELDVDCAKAFRLGVEDTRAKISSTYPDLDISFLDAESSEAQTQGNEESDYEADSEADSVAVPSTDKASTSDAPPPSAAQGPPAFERGGTSPVRQDAPEGSAGLAKSPDF